MRGGRRWRCNRCRNHHRSTRQINYIDIGAIDIVRFPCYFYAIFPSRLSSSVRLAATEYLFPSVRATVLSLSLANCIAQTWLDHFIRLHSWYQHRYIRAGTARGGTHSFSQLFSCTLLYLLSIWASTDIMPVHSFRNYFGLLSACHFMHYCGTTGARLLSFFVISCVIMQEKQHMNVNIMNVELGCI